MENKKKKILISCVIGLVILAAGACFILFGNKEATNKKELENTLKELGKSFYEDYYYPSQEKVQKELKEYLAKFEKTGLRINLENLSKISKTDTTLLDKMVNGKTKEKCDFQNTYVIIYPKAEYGAKDYTIDTKLVCGLAGEEEDTKKVDSSKEETKDSTSNEESKTENTEKNTKK